MSFIVELEAGVWVADVDGDPGRTLLQDNAQQFDSIEDAYSELEKARKYRPFENAGVIDLTVFF